MINFRKVNESKIHIDSDDIGALMELSEYFTYYVEGYKFMPAYRNKMWDGKIRLYSRNTKLMSSGLLLEALKFCKNRKYEFTLEPTLVDIAHAPSVESIKDYLNGLKLTDSKGGRIALRDYQEDAVIHSIRNRKVLVESPTGSGKSLIIYCIVRYFLDHGEDENQKAIVVVPTTSLVEQMTQDFLDYALTDNEFSAEDVHKIYSGKDKETSSRVIVTTWQSIFRLGRSWFTKFGMLIGDEAHQFKATSLNGIAEKCMNASYRIGTTGTVGSSTLNELTLIGNFGPKLKTITTRELIENETLSALHIKCIVLDHDEQLRKVVSKMDYQSEIQAIVSYEKRNEFIKNLAIGLKGNTLVLFNRVDQHGVPLYDLIRKENGDDSTYFVAGSVKTEERETIRHTVEESDGAIIVASMGVFSTGINLKNLHNIIFASPNKSQIKVLQSIGRGLRKAENEQGCTVYDIIDDFKWKKSKNFAFLHGVERIKIYKQQEFDFTMEQVPFKK